MCSASTPEECCFFYSLLACSPRNATKLELSLPETLVFHRGSVHSWIFTNKDGYVNSRSSTNTTLDGTVERKLLAAAKRECRGCSFVAVEHRGHTIRALNEQALARLSVRLSTAATKPMSSGEVKMLPHYLHTFVAASQELRYTVRLSRTTGEDLECNVGRFEYNRQDGVRIDKLLDAVVPPGTKAILERQALKLVGWMQDTHRLVFEEFSAEWVQRETNPQEVVFHTLLGFKVDEESFNDPLASQELLASRDWLPNRQDHVTKVIGRLRRRRSVCLTSGESVKEMPRRNSLPTILPTNDAPRFTEEFTFGRNNPFGAPGASTVEQESTGCAAEMPQLSRPSSDYESVEELDLPIWRRTSVPELAKYCQELTNRCNELKAMQEDTVTTCERHSDLHAKAGLNAQQMDAAHHRMLQQLEQHGQKQIKLQEQLQQQKNGLREEKERSQDFKTVTQREFQLLKEEMEQLRSQCKEQEERLEHTEMRLSCEMDRRGRLQDAHDKLLAKVEEQEQEQERLLKIVRANEAATDNRMDTLAGRLGEEAELGTNHRHATDDRLLALEKMCEMIGFQKYGGMWSDKKKALGVD